MSDDLKKEVKRLRNETRQVRKEIAEQGKRMDSLIQRAKDFLAKIKSEDEDSKQVP